MPKLVSFMADDDVLVLLEASGNKTRHINAAVRAFGAGANAVSLSTQAESLEGRLRVAETRLAGADNALQATNRHIDSLEKDLTLAIMTTMESLMHSIDDAPANEIAKDRSKLTNAHLTLRNRIRDRVAEKFGSASHIMQPIIFRVQEREFEVDYTRSGSICPHPVSGEVLDLEIKGHGHNIPFGWQDLQLLEPILNCWQKFRGVVTAGQLYRDDEPYTVVQIRVDSVEPAPPAR